MKKLVVDIEHDLVVVEGDEGSASYPLASAEAFAAVSDAWLRCGWDTKYVYGFTWLGRPMIQLPDDMMRIQEVVYGIKPDLVIETGIAHGGSLVFYAGLMRAMDRGRIVGVDIEIRPHNRAALEAHELFPYITLVEGSSIDPEIIAKVKAQVKPGETVLVVLDANHDKDHVLAELEAYAPLVSVGSYIVSCDGIMGKLNGAPRSNPDWTWNNPTAAAEEFVAKHADFVIEEPAFPFNEGMIHQRVTYWPRAYIKRLR